MLSDTHIEVHPRVDGGRAWPELLRPHFPGFYLDVGGQCNFACPYCSIDKSVPFRAPEAMERIVRIAGEQRLGTGIFIGGEPSIYPHLERVMEHGQKHGVTDYWIITNGSGLVHRSRVQRLHALGMKVWHLSWDHFDPQVLAGYHGTRPVFANLMRAVDNLAEIPDALVYLYQVVTRQTYPTLPEMVRFVADLRERRPVVRAFIAAVIKAVQEALRNPEVLYPIEDAVPQLRAGAAVARERGLPFWIFNLPACVLPELGDQVFSPYEMDRTLDLATLALSPSAAADEHCTKGPACLGCTQFETCSGYLREYEARFGRAAFSPPPSLRRAEPLPASHLRRRVRLPIGANAAAGHPGPAKGPASGAGLALAPREGAETRLRQLVSTFASEGWRVHALAWDGSAPRPRWLLSLGPAADPGPAPLVAHLEAATAPASFLRSEALALSYRGSALPAAHERVLRALFAFLGRAGDAVAADLVPRTG